MKKKKRRRKRKKNEKKKRKKTIFFFFFVKYLSVEIDLIKCEVQIRISFQDLSIQALITQNIHVHAVVQSALC